MTTGGEARRGETYQMTNSAVPATKNPEWGFFGTMAQEDPAVPVEAAWNAALTAIVAATGSTPDEARAFLDGRYGRQFADDVSNGLFKSQSIPDAIQSAVTRWMGWTISYTTHKETGIPLGLPYLTGFVIHAAIETGTILSEDY